MNLGLPAGDESPLTPLFKLASTLAINLASAFPCSAARLEALITSWYAICRAGGRVHLCGHGRGDDEEGPQPVQAHRACHLQV